VITKNINKNVCARLNDDFNSDKKVGLKLLGTSLAIPEVRFDVTLHCIQNKMCCFEN